MAWRVVRRFAGEVSGAARERKCGDEHVGQHVNSHFLDATKASHRTRSASPAPASGDAGERTQVRTVENKEEFTAAPTRNSGRRKKERTHSGWERATTAGKSGLAAGKKSTANCRQGLGQDEVQDKDQDEVKFKMSVGMGVMNCADYTGYKNVAIITVKGIGGRLNKITETRLDVMCMCFVKEEGDVRGGDLSKEVQALQGRNLHLLRGQTPE